MGLPIPPINPERPIPNNPFYYPESNYLQGEYSPFIIGTGLALSPTGVLSVIGSGGSGVASITAGAGIFVNNATGFVTITNTGVVSLNAGAGITLSGSSGNVTISSSAAGSVTSIVTTGGIQGGPITTAGTISLTNTGVSAGNYSNPTLTVDQKGRITAISSGTSVQSVTGSLPVVSSGGPNPVISVNAASTSAAGVVQLSDSVTNTSSTQAATSLAVKTAFDAAASSIPKSCISGKGSLISGAAASTPVALPLGANNFVLTADSSTVSGLKWAPNSAIGSLTGCFPIVVDDSIPQSATICVNPASLVSAGVVQLVDSLNSTSTSGALTANQGRALQTQLSAIALATNPVLAGTLDATTGLVAAATTAGSAAGFVAGSPLPSPALGNADYFVVVVNTGSYTPPGGGGPYIVSQGDWILSNGSLYTFLDVGYNAPAASTTEPGIVRLATPAEVAAGTDSTIALSPAAAKAVYVACSAFTAKGSFLVASGAGVPVALPVGADGEVLVACSACASGMTWAPASGGGGGSGTVTSVTAGSGLTGGTITTSGTIALDSACVLSPTLLTAQGSLITADSSMNPVALPLGTDGYILSANSSCAEGMEWIVNTGGTSGTVTSVTAGNGLLGGTITNAGTISLNTTCVVQPALFTTKGTIAAASGISTPTALTVGVDGQVLTADSSTPTGLAWVTPTAGTVTSVATSAAFTGGPITTSGTLDLATTTVTAGVYGNPSSLTIDACGRITSATAGSPPILAITGTSPINVTPGQAPVISIDAASTTGAGAVQLVDAVNNTGVNVALTANQGKLLQDQIAALAIASNIVLAGTFDASTATLLTVTADGLTAGFSIGNNLPSPIALNNNHYVIVTEGGVYSPPGGGTYTLTAGDWLLSDGTIYQFLNVGPDLPAASTTTPGAVRLASAGETQTGTDGTIAVTPAGAKATYVACSDFTSKGDLLSASAAGTPSALSIGTDGQVLIADSGSVTGMKWDDAPYIPNACVTGKGALVTGTGSSAPVALPVGTNGQVLAANSVTASGLEWITITQCQGTVTSVGTSAAFTGGPITTSGTLDLAPTGVGAAVYAYPSSITVDACGRLTNVVAGSNPLTAGDFTAKGNILAGTGNGTFFALGVGADGLVLGADSSSPTGLSWVAGGGGGGTGTVTSITAGTGLTGGTITTSGTIALNNTAVTPGSYTLGSFTVDAQGRLTAASNGTAVTSLTAGTGLDGGTITSTGTIALANTAVTPGTYTLSNITVDAQGRITSAADGVAVTSVTAGPGLLGGTITTSGVIELDCNCVLTPGLFTQKGQIITALAAGSPNVLEPGTNGEILAINSAVPNGISWVADCGRTAIQCSTVSAKGDIVVGNAAALPIALPVGADGSVLYADSGAVNGLSWGALPQKINCSVITATGDIIVGNAPNDPTALPVGPDGQVLTADSSSVLGVRWAAPSGVQTASGLAPLVVNNTDSQNPVFSVTAASTLAPGVVQLEDSVTSTSTTLALTANQGKILQDQINTLLTSGGLILAGTYDAAADQLVTVTADGSSAGFLVGSPLPAPGLAVDNYFVIITTAGTFTPTGGSTPFVATSGDWVLADTTAWQLLDIGPEVSSASTTSAGIVRLATNVETVTGTDGTIAVTPVGAKATFVACETFTSKGNILAASGAGTPVALPVGSNDQILTADSACASGVKWAVNSAIPCAAITGKGAIVSGTGAGSPSTLSVGTNGQILVACSTTLTGLCWISPNYITCSQITGKGAIIAGTAVNTPAAVSVGSDGQVLMADATCTTGIKWAAITQCQGTVTSVAPGNGLCGGVITGTGTICLNLNCVVKPSDYTAKGVLLTATAASAPTALSVGATGTFLTADATQASGLRWAAITQCQGTVTSVTAGTGLLGGSITTSGTLALNLACVVQPSAYTAKGSILVATGASAPTALGVGVNGQVLIADSACASGVKWGEAASGNVVSVTGTAPVSVDNTDAANPVISVDAASLAAPGVVQLDNTVVSTSDTTAATASAVKTAFDAALAAQATADDAIPEAAFTALGDILVGSSAGSNLPLSVGADGTVLTADSSAVTGVSWESPTLPAAIGTAPISVDNTNLLAPVFSIAAASTTVSGVVQLNNTVTSNSTTEALTAAQGKALQDQINALLTGGGLTLAGTFNATTSQLDTVTSNGAGAGFVAGSNLPSPAVGNTDYFVIVTTGGSYNPPGGGGPYALTQGDWLVSNGTTYQFLDVGPSVPSASTTTEGIVRLATNVETQTGTNATIAITPASGQATYLKLSSLTAKGSLITASAAGVPSTLAVGANGRVLTACSTCPGGLTWTAQSVGIPTTCITGKGSIITGTSSNTPTALPVGSNGQVLTVDSACPTGLKWATSAASAGIPCALLTSKATLVAGCAAGVPVTVAPPQIDGQILWACSLCPGGMTWRCGSSLAVASPTSLGVVYSFLGCTSVGLGFRALQCGLCGAANVAIGDSAMACGEGLGSNVAIGRLALWCGGGFSSSNIAIGTSAMEFASFGSYCGNIAIGSGAGQSGFGQGDSANGHSNIVIGTGAASCVCSGVGFTGNVVVGPQAGKRLNGIDNVVIGSGSVSRSSCPVQSLSCSVLIGSGIRFPSDSNIGQLALGYFNFGAASDCYWLTGCCDGSIRPGGAVLDCANNKGTLGQFLTSTGSGIVWCTLPAFTCNSLYTAKGQILAASASSTPTALSVGTNGQVLTADSACATGVKWATLPESPAGIPCSTITGKGALVTGTAASAPTSLPVGTDGQVLVARSSATGGLAWETLTAPIPTATPTVLGAVYGCTNAGGGLIALGQCAGLAATPTSRNVFIGFCSGRPSTGFDNIIIGESAKSLCALGDCNIAIGTNALRCSRSNQNIAIGTSAGSQLTTGSSNIFIGNTAGLFTCTGSCQVIIGDGWALDSSACNVLSIGSPGVRWLTGCSDCSIRPAGGLRDCNGNLGTSGQVLVSRGTALQWADPSSVTLAREYLVATTGISICNLSGVYDINRWVASRAQGLAITSCTCIALQANKVYQFSWGINFENANNTSTTICPFIVNASDNQSLVGFTPVQKVFTALSVSTPNSFSTVIAPSVNTFVKVRVCGCSGLLYSIPQNTAFLTITEM